MVRVHPIVMCLVFCAGYVLAEEIVGTKGDDDITVTENLSPNSSIESLSGADLISVDGSVLWNSLISTENGDDTILIEEQLRSRFGGADVELFITTLLETGRGADRVTVDFVWSAAVETDKGDDVVELINGTHWSVFELGSGADTIVVGPHFHPGSAGFPWFGLSQIGGYIYGGSGPDTFVFCGPRGSDTPFSWGRETNGVRFNWYSVADGGEGFDTVVYDGSFDVGERSGIRNMEKIDMADGLSQVLDLDVADVLSLTSSKHSKLVIEGDAQDCLILAGFSQHDDGSYVGGGATVEVLGGVTVSLE